MNIKNEEEIQLSESYSVAVILAVAGGFLDAYTFICRGGVFANAQTGNIVLLGIGLSKGDWHGVRAAIAPIIAFIMGVFIAEIIKAIFKTDEEKALHWRHGVLLIEILILIIAAMIPLGYVDYLVNVLVSFVCSLQVQTFRTVHGNNFASTMCTGNLRSGTDALFRFIRGRKGEDIEKALCYYGVIIFFIFGAVLGAIVSEKAPSIGIFIPVLIYCIAFAVMIRWDKIVDRS